MTNCLLLLSAMLSALIGMGPVARVAGTPAAAVAGDVVQAEIAVAPMQPARLRPAQGLPALPALLAIVGLVMLFVPAVIPAWANRRRQ